MTDSITVPSKIAVIILDMIHGYGWAPGSYGYEMVAKVRELKDAAYAAGVQVIHVQSMRRPTDNVSEKKQYPNTQDIVVIPELQPVDKDILIYKRYLGGFTQNDLDYTMRWMGIDTVIISGASTDNCVLWTAADAYQLHYKVVVVEDCTMVHRQNTYANAKEGALEIIRHVLHGEVIPLDQVVEKYLRPAPVLQGSNV
jgi:nicotinamidase-related amidase